MRGLLRAVVVIGLLIVAAPYVLTLLYGAGHPVSTLMIWRELTGAPVTRDWIDIERIAPALPRSVVAAEDAKFCTHNGIDWDSVRDVIDDMQDGEASRGGSTITQQVAKNLFLWPGRSYVRKALELPLALIVELAWSKQRILEVYLNIAEWGPGTYGIEAATRQAFDKRASELTASEAARLAVVLPNPVDRDPSDLEPRTERVAEIIEARMRRSVNTSCLN